MRSTQTLPPGWRHLHTTGNNRKEGGSPFYETMQLAKMFTRHLSLHASRMQHSRWEKLRKLVHQRWGEKIWHPSDNEQGGEERAI